MLSPVALLLAAPSTAGVCAIAAVSAVATDGVLLAPSTAGVAASGVAASAMVVAAVVVVTVLVVVVVVVSVCGTGCAAAVVRYMPSI